MWIVNLFFIHSKGDLIEHSQPLGEDMYWGGNIEDVKMLLDSKILDSNSIRFFVGYSGWSDEQLNNELKTDSWIVAKPNLKAYLKTKPEAMWKKALKELGGEYAVWANYPVDPGLN